MIQIKSTFDQYSFQPSINRIPTSTDGVPFLERVAKYIED